MKQTTWSQWILSATCCIGLMVALVGNALANDTHHHTGTKIKYSQPISHLIDPNWDTPEGMRLWGENIPSDVDWHHIMEPQSPTAPISPNWVIADDFQDPFDLPVITVRWWGSYFEDGQVVQHGPVGTAPDPLAIGPGVEDGYLISFFGDIPGPRFNPQDPTPDYSRPDGLLGSYVIPFERVRVKETPYIGWDQHRIWEYEADLWAGHLDHPSDLARPDGFHQRPDERYWISIAAEVGHTVEKIPDPAGGGDLIWETIDTGKEAFSHYWGWHTSPLPNYDVATMSHLFMPNQEWQYGPEWVPIQPQHELMDMAFELLTIPEPGSLMLFTLGLAGCLACRKR